jgi:hypothetical protein
MEFTCLGAGVQEFAKCVKTNFSELVKLIESIQVACSDFHGQMQRVRQDHAPSHLTCGYERHEQLLCAFADHMIASVVGPVERLRQRAQVLRNIGDTFASGMDSYVRTAAESNSELRLAVKALRGQIARAASTMSAQDQRQVARQTKETRQLLHSAAEGLRRMLDLVQFASARAHTELGGLLADFLSVKFSPPDPVPSAVVEAFRARIHEELSIIAVFERLAVPAIPAVLPVTFDAAAPSGHQIVDPLMLESKCAAPLPAKLSGTLPLSDVRQPASLPPLKSGTGVTVVEGGYRKIWEVEKNGFRYPCRSVDLTFS